MDENTDLKKHYQQIQQEFPELSPKEIEPLARKRVHDIQTDIIEKRTRFRNFLKGFEEYLPFQEPSHLSSVEMAQIVFDKVKFTKIEEGDLGKTNVRKIAQFLRIAGDLALSKKHPCILKDDLLQASI